MSVAAARAPRRAYGVLLVGALATLASARADAQDDRGTGRPPLALPPGLEREVGALVLPGAGEPDLGGGVEVGEVAILPDRIEVRLRREERAVARVWLAPPEATLEAERAGRTASHAIWIADGTGTPGAREAVAALVARVASRDDGEFWERALSLGPPDEEATRAPPDAASRDWLARTDAPRHAACWLALAALLIFLARRDPALLSPRSRAQRLALAGILALGLALRLTLPSWAPLHANEHGIDELRALAGATSPSDEDAAARYGDAYPMLVRALLSPLGVAPDAVLVLAAIAGVIAIALLHRVAARLFPGRPWAPALVALALAVHPAHVRLSLSESPRPLAGALLLLGVLLGLRALAAQGSVRVAAIGGAAIALAIASELRVITLALPIAGALFVAAAAWGSARARLDRRAVRAAIAGAALVALTGVRHVVALRPILDDASDRSAGLELARRLTESDTDALLDPGLTAPLLMPLAALGALFLWRSGRRRAVVACALALVVLVPPSLVVCACRTDAIRYQSEAHFFVVLALAGLAPRGLAIALARVARPSRLVGAWARSAWGVAPALLVLSALPGLADVASPDVHAQAIAIARATARSGSVPAVVVVPPREMREDRRVRSSFPDYLFVTTRAASAPRVARGLPVEAGERGRDRCAIWIGPACWSFTHDEIAAERSGVALAPGPMRRECVELLGGPEAAGDALAGLEPVSVPHRDREFHRIPAARPRLGLAPCPAVVDAP